MTKTIKAIYEHGVLRPLDPLEGVEENTPVNVTIQMEEEKKQAFARFAGILSPEEADRMMAVIDEDFEKVNPDDWTD